MFSTTCKHCGLIDDFRIIRKSNQDTAWCNGCDASMGNAPQGGEPTLYVGKYKGRTIKSMITPDEVGWLKWFIKQDIKAKLRSDIENHLNSLSNG